jgi:hypothetical protein
MVVSTTALPVMTGSETFDGLCVTSVSAFELLVTEPKLFEAVTATAMNFPDIAEVTRRFASPSPVSTEQLVGNDVAGLFKAVVQAHQS